MEDRKKDLEARCQEYAASTNKTFEVFMRDNMGQAVTQWNFASLRQVLDGTYAELKKGLDAIIQEYENELQKCSAENERLEAEIDDLKNPTKKHMKRTINGVPVG